MISSKMPGPPTSAPNSEMLCIQRKLHKKPFTHPAVADALEATAPVISEHESERASDRELERETVRQTDGWTDTQTDKRTDRHCL